LSSQLSGVPLNHSIVLIIDVLVIPLVSLVDFDEALVLPEREGILLVE
jgi:hypothetical protein